MEKINKTIIEVEVLIPKTIEKVWELWNNPKHIINWYFASDDWHSPRAENNLENGGKFNFRMEAKDGSFGFDFSGVYEEIVLHKSISYLMPMKKK